MKNIISFVACFAVLCVSCTPAAKSRQEASVVDSVSYVQPIDSSCHLSVLVAGDLMQHERQILAAACADGRYDYSSYFDQVTEDISSADVAIANLEVTLGGKPYTGFPCFSAPDEYLSAIQAAGFDLLLTSNNHCCDSGKKGLLRTLQMCDSLHISHIGTYADSAARAMQYPFLLEQGGFRIAILAFTYGTNGLRIPEPIIVNLIDTVQIAQDIAKAKLLRPDLILAFPHWGIEYEHLPRPHMVRLANWLISHGVDHVIGGHPHVIQPVELREDSLSCQQHLVAYSLGNFISDQMTFPRYGGMMLRFQLSKEGPSQPARIETCDYRLTFVSRPTWSRQKNYRIYPVSTPDSLLNATEIRGRDNYVQLARKLFQEHNIGVTER